MVALNSKLRAGPCLHSSALYFFIDTPTAFTIKTRQDTNVLTDFNRQLIAKNYQQLTLALFSNYISSCFAKKFKKK